MYLNTLFSKSLSFDAATSYTPPREDQGWIPCDLYRPTITATIIGIATKKYGRDRRERTNIYLSDRCRYNHRSNLSL